ncbi:MAG: nuclear transport factor 2 family protein [Pseudomonadota bacterium]
MNVENNSFGGFDNLLRSGLGDRLAPGAETLLDMMADDCVFEMPYAPPGFIRRIDGRDALERYLAALPGLIDIEDMFDLRIHESIDPNTVILEFRGEGQGQTGAPYDQQWISVIETRGGHIARYVDYWDPLVTLNAVGDARPDPIGEGFTRA